MQGMKQKLISLSQKETTFLFLLFIEQEKKMKHKH